MEVVKLGKRGQLSIPKKVMNALGLTGGSVLLLETTADGAIMLRLAGVYPIELYSEERIAEFLEANVLTPEEEIKVKAKLDEITKGEFTTR